MTRILQIHLAQAHFNKFALTYNLSYFLYLGLWDLLLPVDVKNAGGALTNPTLWGAAFKKTADVRKVRNEANFYEPLKLRICI